MTPEQIAEDLGFEVVAVKAKLMQVSSKYRKDCGKEEEEIDELNFSNDELINVNKVIYETALAATTPDGSVDWNTRLKAATYIRDDKKGRKDVIKQVAGNQFNIFQLNDSIQRARLQSNEAMKQLTNAEVVK